MSTSKDLKCILIEEWMYVFSDTFFYLLYVSMINSLEYLSPLSDRFSFFYYLDMDLCIGWIGWILS